MPLKIYPASSWQNKHYANDVAAMRDAGYEIFDWREVNRGFRWSCRTLQEYVHELETSPQAAAAFQRDKNALDWCDALVLILPSGRSAHLETGYASGLGKPVVVKLSADEPLKPELLYLLAGNLQFATTTAEILAALRGIEQRNAISALPASAMTLANNDVAQAIEILCEWGFSHDAAFTAIDALVPDEVQSSQRRAPTEAAL